jgi:hypothetical protein
LVSTNDRRGDVRVLEHLTRDRDLFQGRVETSTCDMPKVAQKVGCDIKEDRINAVLGRLKGERGKKSGLVHTLVCYLAIRVSYRLNMRRDDMYLDV